MKRLLIYLIASLIVLLLATLLSQYSFPSGEDQPYGKMIRIPQDNVLHSSASLPAFRRYWKKATQLSRQDTVLRMAVIAVDPADQQVCDSVVSHLRKSFHDPRIPAKWKWSNNWLPADGRDEKFMFCKPSIAVNLQNGTPQHDYTEAWIECNTAPESNTQLTVFCKNTEPETNCTLLNDSQAISESVVPVSSGWQCLHFPFHSGKVQLNIRGETSPLFGNITIEPISGFSIWSLKIPETKNSKDRNELEIQAAVLNPGMLILICEKSNAEKLENCILHCRKLFGNKPILVYSSGLRYEIARQAWQMKTAFVSGTKPASIGLVLQKDIRHFRRAG